MKYNIALLGSFDSENLILPEISKRVFNKNGLDYKLFLFSNTDKSEENGAKILKFSELKNVHKQHPISAVIVTAGQADSSAEEQVAGLCAEAIEFSVQNKIKLFFSLAENIGVISEEFDVIARDLLSGNDDKTNTSPLSRALPILEINAEKTKELNSKISSLAAENSKLNASVNEYAVELTGVLHSRYWRITSPLRWFTKLLRKAINKFPLTRKMAKGLAILLRSGPRELARNLKAKSNYKKKHKNDYKITKKTRAYEESVVFDRDIKISILVPLYNTPILYLQEMIESVQAQTYKNWELCLADGSDAEHTNVEACVQKYCRNDKRIVYKKLEKNLGISENTNACIEISTGDYISLFDHDDLIHPSALFSVMQAICEKDADFIYTDENTFAKTPKDAYCPHHKADFAIDTLRSYNYICHLTTFSRELLNQVGGFRKEFDGSQDYDLILRLTEKAKNIVHIPRILYFWRAHKNSTAMDISAKPYIINSAHKALSEHLTRSGLEGEVKDAMIPSTYKIEYKIKDEPKVSIVIANKDNIDSLKVCLDSVYEKSTYKNFEIIIVENNSTEDITFDYYKSIEAQHDNLKVIYWDDEFNYSAINNFGVKHTSGEHLILLNNDIEIITPDWIEQMLMYSARGDVGAVGAMLYFPDDTIQHAGVIVGIGGVAGHAHKYLQRGLPGYMTRAAIAQNLSAVTAACVMIPRHVYDEVGGLDELYKVAFNDVDLCMKIRKAGYLIVFTPFAEMYHYESKSRGQEDSPEKVKRFNSEIDRFQSRWPEILKNGDPYYNINLSYEYEDFRLK